ncbi:MAG: amidohydrolase, partial [Dermatophilaceae bacterium]
SGTVNNVIPDDARMELSVRSFSDQNRARMVDVIRQVAGGVTAAHGMTAEVVVDHGYHVTVNDAAEFEVARSVVLDLFGADRWAEMPFPQAGSEDMSEVPGSYLFIGACTLDDHTRADDNHSPRAAFDDSVVPDVAAFLAEVALRRARELAHG